jgi:hypothetical protein
MKATFSPRQYCHCLQCRDVQIALLHVCASAADYEQAVGLRWDQVHNMETR